MKKAAHAQAVDSGPPVYQSNSLIYILLFFNTFVLVTSVLVIFLLQYFVVRAVLTLTLIPGRPTRLAWVRGYS